MADTKKRILILDEEIHGYMRYYVQSLEDGGYSVVQCDNTSDAFSKIAEQRFDLIVLDMMMPPGNEFQNENTVHGMKTGIFMAKAIRARYPNLPIFILTNSGNDSDAPKESIRSLLKEKIIQRWLYKIDLTPDDLASTIDTFLKEGFRS